MDSETIRTGGCSCGSISISARGEPLRVSICHCFECQKRSGSTFAQQARFDRSAVDVDGETRIYTRRADSGNTIDFHFCGTCATIVYYVLETAPEHLAIPVGIFSDPSFPQPAFSVYEERMHHWVTLPDGMSRMP